MYILDTDTLTHLYAGHPKVRQRLNAVDDPTVATTIITKIEMLRGRFDFVLKAEAGSHLVRAQQLLLRTEELLAQIPIIPFDNMAIVQFDRLRLARNLRKIGRSDLLIASIVLANRATLVTRNLRHFSPIPNLAITHWVD